MLTRGKKKAASLSLRNFIFPVKQALCFGISEKSEYKYELTMSADQEDVEIDADADVEPVKTESTTHIKSSRKAFSKLATELTDDELNSSGVQKMLLAEISRLEYVALYSNKFKEKYHNADKDRAVLKEKEKTFIFSEILYSVSLTLGAALIGLTPSINSSTVSPLLQTNGVANQKPMGSKTNGVRLD